MGRYTSEGFDLIGLHMVGGMLSQGQHLVNPVAAMPSLHTAYATLAAGFFWFGKNWWQKTLLACYPLAMAFALLYGGEHYIVDEIAGAAYALTIIAVWRTPAPPPDPPRCGGPRRPLLVTVRRQAGYVASSAKVGRSG